MPRRTVQANLTDRHRDMARWLGSGNASRGIRVALTMAYDRIVEDSERRKRDDE